MDQERRTRMGKEADSARRRLRIRQEIGKFTKEQIAQGLSEFEEFALPTLTQGAQASLATQKMEIRRSKLSAVDASIFLISHLATELLGPSLNDDDVTFSLIFDFHHGMTTPLNALGSGRAKIAGTFEEEIWGTRDQLLELVSFDAVTQAESAIGFNRMAQEYAALLRKDVTGFSAVDRSIEWLEKLRDDGPLVKEWVVAGGKTGARIYKEIYPQIVDIKGSK